MSGPRSATCHGAFPDTSFTIGDFAEHGDKIWVRVRARGTASGPFFGPPSNKPIDITVFDFARVANGQILDHWGVPDRFALLAQTGCLTDWRADSVIAVPTCVPSAADRWAQASTAGEHAGQISPLWAALAAKGEG